MWKISDSGTAHSHDRVKKEVLNPLDAMKYHYDLLKQAEYFTLHISC